MMSKKWLVRLAFGMLTIGGCLVVVSMGAWELWLFALLVIPGLALMLSSIALIDYTTRMKP